MFVFRKRVFWVLKHHEINFWVGFAIYCKVKLTNMPFQMPYL